MSCWSLWVGRWVGGLGYLVGETGVEEAAVDFELPADHAAGAQTGLGVGAVHLLLEGVGGWVGGLNG